jgi:2-haloacid dehalogenase
VPPRADILLFDVNETLLDLGALGPEFTRLFGSAEPMTEWFLRLLHGSLVANHTARYRPFGSIALEALAVVADRRQIDLSPEVPAEMARKLRSLPAHEDASPGLQRLGATGFRLVALSNGSTDAVEEQLRRSGLDRYLERTISVDAVERFKPAPEVYLHAAAVLGVDVDRAIMVSAHDWDVLGARSVGMPGAYIARPGSVWGLPDPLPQLVAPDLETLADLLAAG